MINELYTRAKKTPELNKYVLVHTNIHPYTISPDQLMP